MRRLLVGALAVLLLTLARTSLAGDGGPWSVEKANAWWEKRRGLVGCNYVPSTAVNAVEMWQRETFDPTTIERELGWAQELGFDTVRVFLNFVVWKDDPEGTKRRLAQFLSIADARRISTMPVLFDDCAFSGKEPRAGRQEDPVPGVHNSGWVASPGRTRVLDRAAWRDLEAYVKDVVGTFAKDRRVVVWDLYNEPGNGEMGETSLPLVEAAFAWAREKRPEQPLTAGVWGGPAASSRRQIELSDVVSFHEYGDAPSMTRRIAELRATGRPLLCTEWMRRPLSRVETILPLLRSERVGSYAWGLVAGRTQTVFPWGSPKGAPEPSVWFHDLLRKDGTPFSPREVRVIRELTGRTPPRRPVAVVPDARGAAVAWRFTTDEPIDGWSRPGFDDSAWKEGAAPFGAEEAPLARRPRTEWRTPDLWLRRTFEMPAGTFEELVLLLHFDEDATVYVDGVLAAKVAGYDSAYESFEIRPEARSLLTPGPHVLAVRCRQTAGGQYIDVGIEGLAAANGGGDGR